MQLLVLFQVSSYLSKLCNFNSDKPEIKCVPCTSFKKTDVRIVAVDYLDIVNDRMDYFCRSECSKCSDSIIHIRSEFLSELHARWSCRLLRQSIPYIAVCPSAQRWNFRRRLGSRVSAAAGEHFRILTVT